MWHWTSWKNTKESYQTCYFITKVPIQGTSTPSKFTHIKVQKTIRGDMIEVFKLVHNVYDSRVAPSLSYNTSVARGNKFKLQNQSFNHNFRKNFFSARIVNVWNSLPNYVVDVRYWWWSAPRSVLGTTRSYGDWLQTWLEPGDRLHRLQSAQLKVIRL